MSQIKVTNLTFAYPGSYDTVFDNVSFQIDTDWKLGFIGRNGRGKTTFLNLLLGKYEYGGKIQASVPFDYFPYPVKDKWQNTEDILGQICPDAQAWQVVRELTCLDAAQEVLYRPFDTLSNGEQTKVLLAALFLNENHFLLIDEPTNHLDADARQTVADYLKKKSGFILVSHDRAFLDNCADHILSINKKNIDVQSGNFSSWMENFQRQEAYERTQEDRLQKDIGRLTQAAGRTANWSHRVEKSKKGSDNSGLKPDRGYVGHKSAKMMKRAKVIESRRQRAIEDKAQLLQNEERCETLKLSALPFHAGRLVTFSKLSVHYGDRTVCGPLDFTLAQGERIALDGKNGSGKSSILKLILGEQVSFDGTIQIPSQLVISYVPQDTSHLRGSLSQYAREHRIDESLFKTILRKMDFSRVQFEKDISDFSGGQKKKVLIAGSLCEKAHLYIWDEPLNYIDIYSRMQIETLLQTFQPTMLFVEHDRMFREKIATGILKL